MMIGIDLGNATVKTHTKFIIPNLITQKNTVITNEDDEIITIGAEEYVVGRGKYDTEFNKLEKERLMLMLYYTIIKNTNDIGNIVCIGLPINQYKNQKDTLKNYILNNRMCNIELNGKERKVIIEDVMVFSEGLSIFYSLNNSIISTIGNKNVVLIDVGGRTTDVCELAIVNGKRKASKYMTISLGVLNIYSNLISAINEKYCTELKLEQADLIWNEGFYYNGIKQDLNFVKPILKNIIDELFKEININFDLKTTVPLLAGGGGIILEPYFKKRYPHTILVNEPIFGNAIGYYKAGEMLWLSKN